MRAPNIVAVASNGITDAWSSPIEKRGPFSMCPGG